MKRICKHKQNKSNYVQIESIFSCIYIKQRKCGENS